VKSEEWNVYRRYAEFREFHQQIQRYLPNASTFNFPPKKTVGRKEFYLFIKLISYGNTYSIKIVQQRELIPEINHKKHSYVFWGN
jgi:hypothetical protein